MNSTIRDLTRQKFKRKPNTDGLINCLLQPGLFLNQPLKSMRTNINPLINSGGTLTDHAADTKSIGLQADAQLSWFLHATKTVLT
jgi:hypothetical protein